jgi:hypothetical protein
MASKRKTWNLLFYTLFLVIILGLAYLPNITRFPFYRDDWYYMIDGATAGPKIFHAMFSIDRPARGFLFEWIFSAFGASPIPYTVTSVLLRILSGVGAFWLFYRLWPSKHRAAFWAALLFGLFPGYLMMSFSVESLPHLTSVTFMVISFALTIEAIRVHSPPARIVLWTGSVLTGWLYISLIDYAFGMEIFRVMCVFIYMTPGLSNQSRLKKLESALRAWLPAAVIPVGFLFWRFFIFNNTRAETDVGRQFGRIFDTPLHTFLEWATNAFQSVLNVSLSAWFVPLYKTYFGLPLTNIMLGFILVSIATGILVFFEAYSRKYETEHLPDKNQQRKHKSDWIRQAIWIGLVGVLVGILPVILANRSVTFEAYSHYALPASLAATMLITGLVFSLNSKAVRSGLLITLVGLAILTHYANTTKTRDEIETIRDFWWQVAWRAPDLKTGTTLLVQYPSVFYGEDASTVWGPANFVYSSKTINQVPIKYAISALAYQDSTMRDILTGGWQGWATYRTNSKLMNIQNVLILSQPWKGSCVHALDGRWPRLSTREQPEIILVSSKSKIENIDISSNQAVPPELIFGPEPPHDWCFYYQKAEAAVQADDWEEVVRIADEFERLDLHPNDRIEWMPFIQAYAYLNEIEILESWHRRIAGDDFLRSQACTTLQNMPDHGYKLSSDMRILIHNLYCD